MLIIGSGSLIHNLKLAGKKMSENDFTPYGWEAEYDDWIKKQIDERNFHNIINYESSHKLGKLTAPTPDHYVPVLYSLGRRRYSPTTRMVSVAGSRLERSVAPVTSRLRSR